MQARGANREIVCRRSNGIIVVSALLVVMTLATSRATCGVVAAILGSVCIGSMVLKERDPLVRLVILHHQ